MKLPKITAFKKNKIETPQQEQQKAKIKTEEKVTPPETSGNVLAKGMVDIKDIIAPSALEVDFNHIKMGGMFFRTLFVSGYPRFVGANWLSSIINFDHSLDISMFYYPVESKGVLDDLKRKITELEATVRSDADKGKIADPVAVAALEDANTLQEQLVKGVEKFFQFSFYITIPAETLEELDNATKKLEGVLGSLLLIAKKATLQMEQAFQSTIPAAVDKLLVTRNMDTTSLATTFPFTSSDLTMEEGIMYGVNKHNGSLIIFDRFSLPNANTVVFATSGAGKSYVIKLEALRSIIFGTQVLAIDPEEEYKPVCEALGGNYIDFSVGSPARINPFDLSGVATEGENELGQKLLSLHTLLKLMLGEMNPSEEAILDRALIETYRMKGITTDPDTQMSIEPPIMEDLYKVLLGAAEPEARGLSERLERYVKGSAAGIFDAQSNIDLNNAMTVFSTKNLEDAIRPIAFYMILDFVWTRVRKDLRKRIMIVEEAWTLMQNQDSAQFLFGIAKRARKYYLGLTTISQDVDDFLKNDYGQAIVSNSSIQMLFKQHPSAIDKIAETFYLSEGEKKLLLAADRGEGLFFAGANHVAIKVMASEAEHKLITTDPEEILRAKKEKAQQLATEGTTAQKPSEETYKPVQKVDLEKFEKIPEVAPKTTQVPVPAQVPTPPPTPISVPAKKPVAPTIKPQEEVHHKKTPVAHIPGKIDMPNIGTKPKPKNTITMGEVSKPAQQSQPLQPGTGQIPLDKKA